MRTPIKFNLEQYIKPPKTFEAKQYKRPGVKSFYFENEPFHGKQTRVFAWMGMPYLKEGMKCPAMVLVHGGGGTAFDEWVRLWNSRGYAAIAIDLCGHKPELPKPITGGVIHKKHNYSGPKGWDASFNQMNDKIENQWQYHAITGLLRAHSILANLKEIDSTKIGITGISWGGYLTSLMMGIDSRYKAAIPVYGCGFITENSIWKTNNYGNIHAKEILKWGKYWDPMHYIGNYNIPSLWVTGTNDFAYPMDSLKKSYELTKNPTLSVGLEMKHSHEDGWEPNIIHQFTNSIFNNEAPLPIHINTTINKSTIISVFQSIRPIIKVEILYTRALGMWQDRKWNILEGIKIKNLKDNLYEITGKLPIGTTVTFVNAWDDRKIFCSSPHIEI